jgi:hypothetical protein
MKLHECQKKGLTKKAGKQAPALQAQLSTDLNILQNKGKLRKTLQENFWPEVLAR